MALLKAGRFSCESSTLLNHFMIYQNKVFQTEVLKGKYLETHLQCVSVRTV